MENEKKNRPWAGRGKLEQVVAELERQRREKVDFVADTRSMKVLSNGNGGLKLHGGEGRPTEWIPAIGYPIRDAALEQIGEKSDPAIPTKFVKELTTRRPERAADLINGLLLDAPARRFVRVLDGSVRAFLTDKFRVLDNYDMAFASLDAVRACGGQVIEASLSDKHMRLKFTTLEMWEQVNLTSKEGGHTFYGAGANPRTLQEIDFRGGPSLPAGSGTIHPLVTISNSETGHGGFNVSIGIFAGWCTNLAIIEKSVGRVHIGEKMEIGIFSEATLKQESKAIFMKARDAVRAAFTKESFEKMVAIVRKADAKFIVKPTAAVDNVSKAVSLSDEAQESLLTYFLSDYRPTNFGLAQAVSRLAQDTPDVEKAAELETEAGRIIKLAAAVA